MRRYFLAAILLLTFAGAAPAASPTEPVSSERRTALVIGNGDYRLISPLRNPVNDARAMARALRELGFDVIARENLTRYEMRKTIRDFGRKLGQGGVGLFYYAGHGLQIDGVNYMVPLNAPIEFEDDVEVEAVPVRTVLVKLASAQNRLNIVILDSCRNNPYARSFRATTRGLAQMSAPTGTLVAYAAAPGGLAMDGDGQNGVYTGELLEAMQMPGLRIEDVFKRVRVAVRETSEGQQIPWEASSLTGDFYFRPPTSKPSPDPAEAALWQAVEYSTNANDYLAYLEAYPSGVYVPLANMRFDTLKAEAAKRDAERANLAEIALWSAVKDGGSAGEYKIYLRRYPKGEFAALARTRMAAVEHTATEEQERKAAFDGDWILEIMDPLYMPGGDRVRTKIVDNKFSISFSANGWYGNVSGKIDKSGELVAHGSAKKGTMHMRLLSYSTEYVDGSFYAANKKPGQQSNFPFRITLTRASPVSSADQD